MIYDSVGVLLLSIFQSLNEFKDYWEKWVVLQFLQVFHPAQNKKKTTVTKINEVECKLLEKRGETKVGVGVVGEC